MYSECPFCHKKIEGSAINKREASILRSTCKIYYSLLVPLPFVGSYIGGKIYDLISSSDEWYYRFICQKCRCSWTSTNNDRELKIGGNEHLVIFFYQNSFVIGSVENDNYMIETEVAGRIESTIITKEKDSLILEKYENGLSKINDKTFGKTIISQGFYVGELTKELPNGWGACFLKNGFISYGKWQNGKRNGIGYECDFDGKDYKVGYWQMDKFII